MADPAMIEQSIKANDVKPLFSDGFLIGFRIKAKNSDIANARPENATPVGGLLEITFVDESKQQALGRFVVDRLTAEDFSKALAESIKKFDDVMGKGGLTKIMPKSPDKPLDTAYR